MYTYRESTTAHVKRFTDRILPHQDRIVDTTSSPYYIGTARSTIRVRSLWGRDGGAGSAGAVPRVIRCDATSIRGRFATAAISAGVGT